MISFSLSCDGGHSFEGWFRNSADFDNQQARDLVSCPTCGSTAVSKALMAPAVSTGRKKEKLAVAANAEQARVLSQLQELARKVRQEGENVGDRFAEEARKINLGEAEARGIYGEATAEEAKGLLEDGIPFMPMPVLPEDRN